MDAFVMIATAGALYLALEYHDDISNCVTNGCFNSADSASDVVKPSAQDLTIH